MEHDEQRDEVRRYEHERELRHRSRRDFPNESGDEARTQRPGAQSDHEIQDPQEINERERDGKYACDEWLHRCNSSPQTFRKWSLTFISHPPLPRADKGLEQLVKVGLGCFYKHAPIATDGHRPLATRVGPALLG